MGRRDALPGEKVPIINGEWVRDTENHCNYCCRQNALMNVIKSVGNFMMKKKAIWIEFKYPLKLSINWCVDFNVCPLIVR